ncbi:hypothetical protein BDV23DRAFT_156514 [Aspergillus alliaceus]|uniref:Uncharacterized protein n=1 Tax=Petromyces alliaceus TaxID=209559 RepID=A0A5N7C6P6_PETAA|nr:hypothetical protein BDV23DRAFT_156514 [Aspergillus alliaceus]
MSCLVMMSRMILIFSGISIGIAAKRDHYISTESYWTENGGEVNDNFSMNMAGMGRLGPVSPVSATASGASPSAFT